MKIKIGDCFPEVTLFFLNDGKPEKVKSSKLFNNKNIVLVSVPGAFTPTCSNDHLPGYIKNIEKIKNKGIDEILAPLPNFFKTTLRKNGFENNLINYDLEFENLENFKLINKWLKLSRLKTIGIPEMGRNISVGLKYNF